MDFSRIKALVKGNGDKFIFLEDGEPEMVVLSFSEYEKLVRSAPAIAHASTGGHASGYRAGAVHPAVVDSADLADAVSSETEFFIPDRGDLPPSGPEDIRLEDLPI